MMRVCVGGEVRPESTHQGQGSKLRNSQLYLIPCCVKAAAALYVSALPGNDKESPN